MSTLDTKTHPVKRYTFAEIDSMLASEPHAVAQTCEQLCEALQSDADELQFIDVDFPASRRAAVRKAILRDMASLRVQMRSQKCSECS